jgi:hypothetical protein
MFQILPGLVGFRGFAGVRSGPGESEENDEPLRIFMAARLRTTGGSN